jgi:hypothetical protein
MKKIEAAAVTAAKLGEVGWLPATLSSGKPPHESRLRAAFSFVRP